MLTTFLTATLLAPLAADKTEPPAKLELFAAEKWYRDQKGKEEEFVGVLHFKDRPKDTVGFDRFNPYTLDVSDGKAKKMREVYVGSKPELLKPYIGKKVKLIGKAVDMEVEGKSHREIWPARLEVVPEKKKDESEPDLTLLRQTLSEARGLSVISQGWGLRVLAQVTWNPPNKETQQLVVRSAAELAKAAGKDKDIDKVTGALAKAAKVEKIDWTEQMIVIFSGGPKRTGGYSVEIVGVSIKDKELTIQWRLNSPKPGSIVTEALTHPAAAALVERCDFEKVRFEQAKSDDDRQRAIRAIEKLGGTVEVDKSEPDKPVRFVYLQSERVRDHDLVLLKALPGLRVVSLTDARITDEGLRLLGEMPELTSLYLRNTAITDAGLVHLKGLKRLFLINLSDTAITDKGLEHIARMPQVTMLRLDGTKVTDEGLGHLKPLKKLWVLGLDRTAITDEGLAHLAGFDELDCLDLNGTGVTGRGLKCLAGLPNLKRLFLNGSKMNDAGVRQLRHFPALAYVDLDRTNVTDAALQDLDCFRSRKIRISLNWTKVTAEGMTEARKRLPWVRFGDGRGKRP
jgi:hypothetical protein